VSALGDFPKRRLRGADVTAEVGRVTLPNPVMAASGCFGTGAELLGVVDATRLGAVVTKSMSAQPWPGNPPPRLAPAAGGMLNSVGLQNPGVHHWLRDELPPLAEMGVRVVASIWGRSLTEYEKVAEPLSPVAGILTAVEVNLSCPNLSGGSHLFAHDPAAAAEVVAAVAERVDPLPVWAKLSPNVASVVPAARACAEAGADAVVLTNTLIGMEIDVKARRPVLGNGTGGLSGPPLRPVALRMVAEVAAALPDLPIVGVGGISRVDHAVQFAMAGASAVAIGTAHLADPHAGVRLAAALPRRLRRLRLPSWSDARGLAL